MNHYRIDGADIDSVELKCLVVSRGLRVDKEVYRRFSPVSRLDINPLTCNCLILSDGTLMQMTDTGFHLRYLSGILSWNNLKLLRYASELDTPFSIKLADGQPALFWNGNFLDFITFPPRSEFYKQKTASGMPYMGNAVLQGVDWVSFQCLWPCEYAAAGKPCQFCFSGGDFETRAQKGKPQPPAAGSADVAEIINYAVENEHCRHVQITGGSTFNGETEAAHIRGYLQALRGRGIPGEILLYITPPGDPKLIDEYFSLGVSRVACSLEVWDEGRAKTITPGKMELTTRKRHLEILEYATERYGAGRAFSNLIIGLEDFETLKEGATRLAERGILPAASVWMPMGRPVMGSMRAPEVSYYRRVKELFAELYEKYRLEPTESHGLNVCIERDIWNYSRGLRCVAADSSRRSSEGCARFAPAIRLAAVTFAGRRRRGLSAPYRQG